MAETKEPYVCLFLFFLHHGQSSWRLWLVCFILPEMQMKSLCANLNVSNYFLPRRPTVFAFFYTCWHKHFSVFSVSPYKLNGLLFFVVCYLISPWCKISLKFCLCHHMSSHTCNDQQNRPFVAHYFNFICHWILNYI